MAEGGRRGRVRSTRTAPGKRVRKRRAGIIKSNPNLETYQLLHRREQWFFSNRKSRSQKLVERERKRRLLPQYKRGCNDGGIRNELGVNSGEK